MTLFRSDFAAREGVQNVVRALGGQRYHLEMMLGMLLIISGGAEGLHAAFWWL